MKRFITNFIYLTCILTLLGALGIMGLFYFFGKDLPDYSQLKKYNPPVLTRLYAADGELFAEYAKEKRIFVPVSFIPKHIIQTFLVVEDEHFYDHFGLSIPGILRALINNIKNKLTGSKGIMGGSTITQQVAKNFLLTNDKTYQRKIKEAILSIRIERALSKNRILELYLNEIFFGSRSYGIAAAALNYFNKPLDKLTVAEAAFLAALPKAPNNYNPKRYKKAALARRNWVISRMLEEKLISQEQALEAQNQDITLKPHIHKTIIHAPYFAEEVRRSLAQKYGLNTLYEEGLAVHTTLNSKYQRLADEALRNGIIAFDRKKGWRGPLKNISLQNWSYYLGKFPKPSGTPGWYLATVLNTHTEYAQIGFKNGQKGIIQLKDLQWARKNIPLAKGSTLGPKIKSPDQVLKPGDIILVSLKDKDKMTFSLQQLPEVNGALVVLDPHTGKVLALSGGFSFDKSQFNRATQAWRQTGSAFKPFTYLAAFEQGYTPTSLILDAPFVYDAGPGQALWKPQNIEKRFFGTNTLRVALEKSMNASIVRLAHTIGMDPIISVARRFGIYKNLPPYLSAVLGSEETTLLQFTAAYGMLANGGKKITPYMIDLIQDRTGKIIFKQDKRTCSSCKKISCKDAFPPELKECYQTVTDPISAYQIVSILEGASKHGTGRRGRPKNHIVGIKTGTSNDYKDTWTIGFSKDLVVGIYIGYDQPRSLGRYNTGGSVASPVFKEFMEKALKGQPPQPFKVPQNAYFALVNRKTGRRTTKKDKEAVLEAFKPGQTPNEKNKEKSSILSNDLVSGIY
jgi:penicillin-binding protein 1A